MLGLSNSGEGTGCRWSFGLNQAVTAAEIGGELANPMGVERLADAGEDHVASERVLAAAARDLDDVRAEARSLEQGHQPGEVFGPAVTDHTRVPAGEHDVLAVFARERQGERLPGLTEPGAAHVEKKVGSTSGAFELGG